MRAVIPTHRPVGFSLQCDAGGLTSTAHKSTSRLPTEQVFGPRAPEICWQWAREAVFNAFHHAKYTRDARVIQQALNRAMREWSGAAELNIADVTATALESGRFPRGSIPAVKQVPMLGCTKATVAPGGAALRWLARRVNDVKRIDDRIADEGATNADDVRDREALVDAMQPTPWWVPVRHLGVFGRAAKRCADCCCSGKLNR